MNLVDRRWSQRLISLLIEMTYHRDRMSLADGMMNQRVQRIDQVEILQSKHVFARAYWTRMDWADETPLATFPSNQEGASQGFCSSEAGQGESREVSL